MEINTSNTNSTAHKPHRVVWLLMLGFVLFYSLFPTLRVVLIGTENAKNLWEYAVSALPDMLLFGLLGYFTFLAVRRKNGTRIYRLDAVVLFLFLGNMILGSILSQDAKLILLGSRMTYFPMLMYACARLLQEGEFMHNAKQWLHRVMLWFTIWSLLSLVFYLAFPSLLATWETYIKANVGEYFIPRLNSIYYSPTVNGVFCAFSTTYYIIQYFDRAKSWFLAFASINFCALLLSMSRGGIIAYFLILVVVMLFFYQKWKAGLRVLVLHVALFFLTLRMVGLSLDNFYWVFSSTKETLALNEKVSRVQLWKDTFHRLTNNPGGYGIGKSGWIAYRFLKGSKVESAYLATDGWYLKIANETGIFGLISFLFLFLFLLYRLFFSRKNGFSLVVLCLVTMVFLVNIVSNVLDYFLFNALFWFLVGAYQNSMEEKPIWNKSWAK
jgi:O-antigen ligase